MSKPKRRAPAAPAKNPILEEEGTTQPEKTMEDLPPEVLTIILEHATHNESRNHVLVYRIVNSQWKEIVDSLLEREVVSQRLDAFPEMKVGGQPDQLSVYCPRAIFRPGRDPLSFNSLLLNGYKNFPQGPTDTQMALPIFISKFGSNLTTFALQDQIIGTKSLALMLRTMSNLKFLCLEDVELTKRSIGPGGILQPPPLPSLTTLKLKSESYYEDEGKKINPLYVWLAASYADQLVCLSLETYEDSLPALQKEHEYCTPGRRGENVSIATTSDSAFGKLTELNVFVPSPQFLRFTETPALRRLTITYGLAPSSGLVNLQDLKRLIGTCVTTLQEVTLDVEWEESYDGIGAKNCLTAGVVARNVKKLTLRFSDDFEEDETTFRVLLPTFPALEVIQLIHYNSYELDYEMVRYGRRNQGGNQLVSEANESDPDPPDEIKSLKTRLTRLNEQKSVLVRRRRNTAEMEARFQIGEAIITVGNERFVILKRLAALGENLNKVVIEQMLEEQGVLNTCPNLKTVSVSVGEKPIGDVCLIRISDDA